MTQLVDNQIVMSSKTCLKSRILSFRSLLALLSLLILGVNQVWAYWTTDRDGNTQADNVSIKGYVSNSGSTYYVLDDATERSIELNLSGNHVEYNYNINGPAAILTFEAKRQRWTAIGHLHVAQRIIGGGWSDKYDNNPSDSYEKSGDITLDEKAVELSFYSNDNGGAKRYFKKVKVTMASYCEPEKSSVTFDSKLYGIATDEKSLKIYWSNIGNKTISTSGDTDRFTLSTTTIPSKAGYYGNTVVTIAYKHDVVGSHSMTLTVNGKTITVKGTTEQATPRITTNPTASRIAYQAAISTSTITPGVAKHPSLDLTIDGTWSWQDGTQTADAYKTYTIVFTPAAKYNGGYSTKTCAIKIPITKLNQTITWDLTPDQEYATGALMNAIASSAVDGLQVTYTPNAPGEGVAGYINENNRLVVVEPNKTITITAHQGGNDNWNDVDSVKTIITLGANPNQFADVHATDITYGDLLGASTLTGKVYLNDVEIAGKLSWVDPMIMPNAGTADHMVLFTPDNLEAYGEVYFLDSVKVDKATPQLKWNITNALREKTKYSHFVSSSNPKPDLDISIIDEESKKYLSYAAGVLTVDSIAKDAEGNRSPVKNKTIHVHQDASANYKELNADFVVTIYPKADQCLPVNISVIADTTKIQNMGAAYIGSHEWCKLSGNVDTTYLIANVTYSLYNGIQLGRWDEGLTPLKQKLEKMGFLEIITGKPIEVAIEAINAGLPGTPKSIELAFTGVPESLSFDTKLQTVIFDLGGEKTANQQDPKWFVYQKSINGIENVIDSFPAYTTTSIQVPLDSTSRAVRIELNSAFAGFIQNLNITQKQYIRAEETPVTFGDGNPLQAPQKLKISYSSIGSCDIHYDTIIVSTDNPAFYVDKDMIISNVGLDHMGVDSVFVRCNDVGQTGNVIFKAKNTGVELQVPVSSATPVIKSAANTIFQTGTEHAPEANSDYRALRMHDFFNCFDGNGDALFDYLYIFGVTSSDTAKHEWEYDASKKYYVPKVNAANGNVFTPCFVYAKNAKNNTEYVYTRTFDAATIALEINGSKNGFVGYKPAGPSIQVSGNAGIYLDSVEMKAANAVFAINGVGTIHARGINKLTSSANAAIQLAASAKLNIEDSWTGEEASAKLALIPATGHPSIDLGSASGSVTINGTQLELHNAKKKAIAHMSGTTELEDGEVIINDGSIYGEATLGMPLNTYINGGTFNQGTIQCYTNQGTARRPWNSNGDLLVRKTMTFDALPVGYGKSHLTLDANKKVNPMLLDEELCIFYGNKDENPNNDENWNKVPDTTNLTSEVLIKAHMVIEKKELAFKMMALAGGDTVSVTVNSDAGLKIGKGGLIGSTPKNFTLAADSTGKTGHLRISPEYKDEMPKAKIELFSKGYYDKSGKDLSTSAWQIIGSPIADKEVMAKSVFKTSWVYSWDEANDTWVNNRATLKFAPFVGYETTQYKSPKGVKLAYEGHLISSHDEVLIDLNCDSTGFNALANSFVAPIDIAGFDKDEDFINAHATIHILNAGSKEQSQAQIGDVDAPGKFLSIPVDSWEELVTKHKYPRYIPSMQGFFVQADTAAVRKTGVKPQVKLNYENLVWNVGYSEVTASKSLRAPKRSNTDVSSIGSLQVTISDAKGSMDKVYMLESDRYENCYENGYDALKIVSEDMNIFTINGEDYLAVNSTNDLNGTRIGIHTGDTTAYALTFSNLSGDKELLLLDKETEQTTDISEGMEYTFFAAPNSVITDRFQIITVEKAPEIATGVDNTKSGVKVQKFIKDNQLYILKNGVLYNATGVVVAR